MSVIITDMMMIFKQGRFIENSNDTREPTHHHNHFSVLIFTGKKARKPEHEFSIHLRSSHIQIMMVIT